MPRPTAVVDTIDRLAAEVDQKKVLDVGKGVEKHLNLSERSFRRVLMGLSQRGYKIHHVRVSQKNGMTCRLRLLAQPDLTQAELYRVMHIEHE